MVYSIGYHANCSLCRQQNRYNETDLDLLVPINYFGSLKTQAAAERFSVGPFSKKLVDVSYVISSEK